ncbi:hypothetical protein R3P38DRAFT_3235955 [Favolaschia claudopus]|uniref:Uncharacterized protein n=1 Tax=Favolaschia claudopus TaxID=2862362 RepID=A0AAV9ZDG8_9AGAR
MVLITSKRAQRQKFPELLCFVKHYRRLSPIVVIVTDYQLWRKLVTILCQLAFLVFPDAGRGVVCLLVWTFAPRVLLELGHTAEEHLKKGETSVFYHRLTSAEEDLILGVYSIKMNQLNHIDPSGHQEKRVSWWPQAGAFFNSELNVGWWTQDCENWFQEILGEFRKNTAQLLNNARWAKRIRGYNAALRASKNLDAICADFLDTGALP